MKEAPSTLPENLCHWNILHSAGFLQNCLAPFAISISISGHERPSVCAARHSNPWRAEKWIHLFSTDGGDLVPSKEGAKETLLQQTCQRKFLLNVFSQMFKMWLFVIRHIKGHRQQPTSGPEHLMRLKDIDCIFIQAMFSFLCTVNVGRGNAVQRKGSLLTLSPLDWRAASAVKF